MIILGTLSQNLSKLTFFYQIIIIYLSYEKQNEHGWNDMSIFLEWIEEYTIKTCSSHKLGSCIWCWYKHLLHRASQGPLRFIGWVLTNFHSFFGRSQSYLQYSLNWHLFTSFVLEHIENRQNLPVIWHQGFSNHLTGQDKFLDLFQSYTHYLVILGW